MINAVDLSLLKAHPRLVEYLIEDQCKRLELYLSYAKDILVLNKFIDDKYNKRQNNYKSTLSGNKVLRENHVADYIKETVDIDLIGIIEVQTLGSDPTSICHLFARLVIDHEDDNNSLMILDELSRAGIPMPSGTCNKEKR